MRKTKYVRDQLRENRSIASEMMLLYTFQLAIKKNCRHCVKILDKWQRSNEQDLDKIMDEKQYCLRCQKIIRLLHQKVDEKVA